MVPENMESGFEESSPLTGSTESSRNQTPKKETLRRVALPVFIALFLFVAAIAGGSAHKSSSPSTASSTTSSPSESNFEEIPERKSFIDSVLTMTENKSENNVKKTEDEATEEITESGSPRVGGKVGGPNQADSTCTGDSTVTPITTTCSCDSTKPVLMGVDVVSYFQMEQNSSSFVQGSSNYSTQLNGYTFYFSSQENLDTFTTSPWDYAPQYGAYCSYGVSEETIDLGFDWEPTTLGPATNPAIWEIVNNKLYLFYTEEAREKWNDVGTNYQDGESRWSEWFGDSESGVFNTACYAIDLADGASSNASD